MLWGKVETSDLIFEFHLELKINEDTFMIGKTLNHNQIPVSEY